MHGKLLHGIHSSIHPIFCPLTGDKRRRTLRCSQASREYVLELYERLLLVGHAENTPSVMPFSDARCGKEAVLH